MPEHIYINGKIIELVNGKTSDGLTEAEVVDREVNPKGCYQRRRRETPYHLPFVLSPLFLFWATYKYVLR